MTTNFYRILTSLVVHRYCSLSGIDKARKESLRPRHEWYNKNSEVRNL